MVYSRHEWVFAALRITDPNRICCGLKPASVHRKVGGALEGPGAYMPQL